MSADGSVVGFSSPEDESHRRILGELLAPLRGYLGNPEVMELCINTPGEMFLETTNGWQRHPIPEYTLNRLMSLARATATFTAQSISEASPLLSATLPDGERVQIVMAPAVPPGTISLTLRKPAVIVRKLAWFAERHMFEGTRHAAASVSDEDLQLRLALTEGRIEEFLAAAVKARKNIVISGATGSGKTTLAKSLALEIPSSERLITIEDVAEMSLPDHPNHVRLFYSRGGKGKSKVTPQELLESTLRMKPDRILLSELRGAECFTYLRNAASGHPGSITTCHASSAALAFEQLSLMVRQSEGGATLDRADIKSLLVSLIDVVVQVNVQGGRRRVTEIYFEPERKFAQAVAA